MEPENEPLEEEIYNFLGNISFSFHISFLVPYKSMVSWCQHSHFGEDVVISNTAIESNWCLQPWGWICCILALDAISQRFQQKTCRDKLATNICETDSWQMLRDQFLIPISSTFVFFFACISMFSKLWWPYTHIEDSHMIRYVSRKLPVHSLHVYVPPCWRIHITCAYPVICSVQHLDFRFRHCWFWVLCGCETKDRRGHAYFNSVDIVTWFLAHSFVNYLLYMCIYYINQEQGVMTMSIE